MHTVLLLTAVIGPAIMTQMIFPTVGLAYTGFMAIIALLFLIEMLLRRF